MILHCNQGTYLLALQSKHMPFALQSRYCTNLFAPQSRHVPSCNSVQAHTVYTSIKVLYTSVCTAVKAFMPSCTSVQAHAVCTSIQVLYISVCTTINQDICLHRFQGTYLLELQSRHILFALQSRYCMYLFAPQSRHIPACTSVQAHTVRTSIKVQYIHVCTTVKART